MTDELRNILDRQQMDDRLFRGRTRPTEVLRVFGGEVAGQALIAAARIARGHRGVHSLQDSLAGS